MLYFGFFLFANSVTFLTFVNDKARSTLGEYRVPEFRMLMFAAFGGSLGAVFAQRLIRHKTRKQPFADMLLLIVGLQLGAVFALGSFCFVAGMA